MTARSRDEHGPLLDAELDRQRSAVDEREELARVHILCLLLTWHDLDICVSQLRACHEHADAVHVSRRQGARPRGALVGLPVDDVELVGGVHAYHGRAGAGRHGELGDDRGAVRAGQLAHGYAGSLTRIEGAGRAWARDDGRQKIEVRIAAIVGPVADLEAWYARGAQGGGGVRALGAAHESKARDCGDDRRHQAVHKGSLATCVRILQQPNTARIRCAVAISDAASPVDIFFPACACVSLMKSCSLRQAVTRSPAVAAARAALSFPVRLVAIPLWRPRLVTEFARLAIWVGALRTVTANALPRVLPLGSDAVHVTVVFPIGKLLPDGGRQVTGTTPAAMSRALAT